jgi:hypothetical protein
MTRKQPNLQAGQGDPAYMIYALPLALAVLSIVLTIVGGNALRTLGLIGCCLANIFTTVTGVGPLLQSLRNRAWRYAVESLPFLIIWLLTTVMLFIYSSIWLTAMILTVGVLSLLIDYMRSRIS